MSIEQPLFESERIRLTPVDHDQDPEVVAGWTRDPRYTRMLQIEPVRPSSKAQVKKQFERLEKELEENKNMFYFAVRTHGKEGDEPRLIGFAQIYWIEWSHGTGNLRLGIGDPQNWQQGYGKEILGLLLRYAFDELNLHRLSAVIPEYNQAALHLFKSAGFQQEVCRREALHRDGRRWDLLHFGLLQREWAGHQAEKKGG